MKTQPYKQKKRIAVSGGLDPIHVGHIRMMQEASKLGDLIVFLNSDDFLMRKKGYVFMTFEQRKEIIESIKYVKEVVAVIDTDNTVCNTLNKYRPDIFVNGGDRTKDNVPEVTVCKHLGIEMLFGVGGTKIQSSSELIKNAFNLGDK